MGKTRFGFLETVDGNLASFDGLRGFCSGDLRDVAPNDIWCCDQLVSDWNCGLDGVSQWLTLADEEILDSICRFDLLAVEREDVNSGNVVDVDGHPNVRRSIWVGVAGEKREEGGVGAFEELGGRVGEEVSPDDIPWSQVSICLVGP